MEILIGIAAFVFTTLLLEVAYAVVKTVWKPESKNIQRRLRTLSSLQYSNETIDILKKKTLSEVPWLNRVLLNIKGMRKIEHILDQADTAYPAGFFILLSLLLLLTGAFTVSFFTSDKVLMIAVSACMCAIPFIYIHFKKKKRILKFQRQLPEALELIARALRAGHAFTGGLKLVVEEFDDPIGTEFEKMMNEINFGIGIPDALKNLASRIDCDDLKFFIISIIIQRETGGNLAEILENLAMIIRDRFKLQGRIRVLSAEGKFSAVVLVAIPFMVIIVLSWLNPGYIGLLLRDPIGKVLILFSVLGMLTGIFVMKRMISIKV